MIEEEHSYHPHHRRSEMSGNGMKMAVGVGLTAAVIGLAGCSDADTRTAAAAPEGFGHGGDSMCLDQDVSGLALVLPVHEGAATGAPEQFRCEIRAAIEQALPIRVITAEGVPQVAVSFQANPDRVNPTVFAEDVQNAEASLIAQIVELSSTSSGNDTWGALLLAADELSSVGAGGEHGLILSRDNGHSDTGLLRMADAGMTAADPDEVASYVAANAACGRLEGITVQLHGVGETREPHPQVSARQKGAIGTIYMTALDICGADATNEALPATGEGPITNHTTRPVAPDDPSTLAPPEPSQEEATQEQTHTIYAGQDILGFAPDQDEFLDPKQATAVLQEIADHLNRNPDTHVEIRGRTAAGPTAWTSLEALGLARADRCAETLIRAGVDPAQISTIGGGYQAQPPITDPATAAQNRVTEFTFRTG